MQRLVTSVRQYELLNYVVLEDELHRYWNECKGITMEYMKTDNAKQSGEGVCNQEGSCSNS